MAGPASQFPGSSFPRHGIRRRRSPMTLARSLAARDLGFNAFTNFSLPAGLTNLSTFYFAGNPLTSLALAPGLAGMTELNLSQNQLTSFTLPVGMTNLIELNLFFNQLTNLTFGYLGNPLTSLVLPEPLAATNLAGDVAFLRNQGI